MIFVGDLHGKIELLEEILAMGQDTILIGDYLDSFSEPINNQIKLVKRIIELKKQDKIEFLLGNHELSYINPRAWKCSGFNPKTRFKLLGFMDDLIKYGLYYYRTGNMLVTHAGVSAQLWDEKVGNIQDIHEALDSFIFQIEHARGNEYSWLYQCGDARGGNLLPYGGPFWCDWTMEFVPVKGLRQIVGHTAQFGEPIHFKQEIIQGLRKSDNGDWCIDCLDLGTARSVLQYQNGKLSPLEF